MSKGLKILIVVLLIPIIWVMVNPSMELGSFGIILGIVGTFVAPLLIVGIFIYYLFSKNKPDKV